MQPDHGRKYIHELDRNTWCNISNLTQNKKFLKTTCYLSGGLILHSANLYLLVYRNTNLHTDLNYIIKMFICIWKNNKFKKKTFTQTYMYHYHTSNKRPWINLLKISIKSIDSYALIQLSLRISNFNMIHSRCFLYSQINEFVESKRVIHVYLSSSLLM